MLSVSNRKNECVPTCNRGLETSTTTQFRLVKKKEVRNRQLNERRNRDRGILMRLLEDWEMVECEKKFHVTDTACQFTSFLPP